MAAEGPCRGYVEGLKLPVDGELPEGRGPTGTCFREGRPVVVQDWQTNPSVIPWRERAAHFGLRSSAAFPVLQEGRPVGVLTLYSLQPDYFHPQWWKFLDGAVANLGHALERLASERLRAEAERARHASEERFRQFFEVDTIAKSLAGSDCHLLHVNDAYCRMLGYDREELLTLSFHQFTHPDDIAPSLVQIRRLLRGEASTFRLEKRYLHKDGHIVWGDLSTVLVRDAQDQAMVFVSDILDISDRKRMEQELQALNQTLEARVARRTVELQAANQSLEAFAYSVSHDLRAPLRTLAGFSELLLQEQPPLPEATRRSHLQRIHAGALRMSQLIDDLLRLSRLGREGMSVEDLDLAEMIREAFQQCREREPGRKAVLHLSGPMPTRGDARLLRVLLENLVGNAWKFTEKETEAVVEAGPAPRGEGFFIKDNGVGFPMAQAGGLFTPFQRLPSAEGFPGTGIGLALAKRIVDLHEGRIWAESEPGRGTCIGFTLAPPEETSPCNHP
jgi:PAS domain S-box-containing protein